MKISKEFSGNEFEAKKKAVEVFAQVAEEYPEGYNITFWNKEVREKRHGAKRTTVYLSLHELNLLVKQIDTLRNRIEDER